MPRNGSGVYSKPAGTTAVNGTTIDADKFNEVIDDIAADQNAARPISVGGTGSSTAAGARVNLGVQAVNDGLTSIASLGTAADKLLYTTDVDQFAEADITEVARTLLAASTAETQRQAIGANSAANLNEGTLSMDRLDLADQGSAEDGTSNDKVMTPLATSQAIAVQANPILEGKIPTDKTSVRTHSTAYLNSTPKALVVSFVGRSSSSSNGRPVEMSPDGTNWDTHAFVPASTNGSFLLIVPPSWSMRINGGIQSDYNWWEWE